MFCIMKLHKKQMRCSWVEFSTWRRTLYADTIVKTVALTIFARQARHHVRSRLERATNRDEAVERDAQDSVLLERIEQPRRHLAL